MPEIIFVSPTLRAEDPFLVAFRDAEPAVRSECSLGFLEYTHVLNEICLIFDRDFILANHDAAAALFKQSEDVRPPILLFTDAATIAEPIPDEVIVFDGVLIREMGVAQARATIRHLATNRYLRQRLLDSEKLAILGNIMAGVLHELKNPLNNLLGSLDRVATLAEHEPGMVKWADMVRRNGNMLRTSIVDLLAGLREDHDVSDVDLHDILEQALEYSMKGDMALRHIDVHRELSAIDPIVHGSAGRLLHLFLNLIVNAKQAIGKQEGSITVRTYRTGNKKIGIEIQDTGPGIASSVLPGIFHQIQTTKIGGSGVGLTLVRRIVEEHNGTIDASNSPDSGARFRVMLPASA